MLAINSQAKGLIFDLDGTLADSMPLHLLAWHKMAQIYGFVMSAEIFYKYAGTPTYEFTKILNRELNINLNPDEAEPEKEQLYLDLIAELKPVMPVYQLLLSAVGKYPIGVGTGSPYHTAKLTLDALNLSGKIDVLITYDDVTNPKPHPETFLKCAEGIGIAPPFCQVFEDGDVGLTAARTAGMIATDIRPFVK